MFEPLLLEECAAQMLRGQEEGQVLTSQVSAAMGAGRAVFGQGCLLPSDQPRQALHGAAPGHLSSPFQHQRRPTASTHPAVAASTKARPDAAARVGRQPLPPGATGSLHENDMVLLSRDNPEVGGQPGGGGRAARLTTRHHCAPHAA